MVDANFKVQSVPFRICVCLTSDSNVVLSTIGVLLLSLAFYEERCTETGPLIHNVNSSDTEAAEASTLSRRSTATPQRSIKNSHNNDTLCLIIMHTGRRRPIVGLP